MGDAASNDKKVWEEKQEATRQKFRVLMEKQTRGADISSDEVEMLKNQYFEQCKGEANIDMRRGYLDQLTDVYVEAKGTVASRVTGQWRPPEENLVQAMRRATTLFARLGYDSGRMTRRIEVLTWVVALSALFTLVAGILTFLAG